MNYVIALLGVTIGFLTGRMLWMAMRTAWSRPPLLRENFQGASIPTATGIVIAMTLIGIESLRMIAGSLGLGDAPGLSSFRAAAIVVVVGFAMLGLLDDLVGTSNNKGFSGHVRGLLNGELTSGGIKLIGGGAIALVAAGLTGDRGIGWLLVDAAIIALSANFINLLDVRPGRAGKMSVFLGVVLLVAAAGDRTLIPLAIVIGAAAALLFDDLRERLMLGDTGANALGAMVGLGFIAYGSSSTRIGALVLLIGLNVLSEFVSFSRLIDRFGPFRILDNLGRRRPPVVDVRESAYSFADGQGANTASALDLAEFDERAMQNRLRNRDTVVEDFDDFNETASRSYDRSSRSTQKPSSSSHRNDDPFFDFE